MGAEVAEYFKLGEQAGSLLPVSQVQVGDEGRKCPQTRTWGKCQPLQA